MITTVRTLSIALAFVVSVVSPLSVAAVPASALPNFASLVSDNAKAVVNISTTQTTPARRRDLKVPDLPEDSPFRDFFRRFLDEEPQQRDSRSLGSGFIVSADGFILTSAHVIADASEIVVRLNDRRELVAKVVGADKRSDVALLKVDADSLPTVTIGNPKQLEVGAWVLAIGSPFGFESTATAGIVSAKGRSLPNENYVPFIQTDVAINPGNSGGPLFDMNGEVVGINAQIYSRTGGFMGLSFAVPIDIAIEVTEQLKSVGRVTRGWLGVLIQNVTRELAESFSMDKPVGALVSEIVPGSPAAESDLKPGDVIVSYNGKPLSKMSDLPPMVGLTAVGEEITVKVIRGGKAQELSVVIGELPVDAEELALRTIERPVDKAKAKVKVLGMTVEDLKDEDKKELGLNTGVKVLEVENGPARRAGLEKGDVLVQLQGQPITSVDEFRGMLAGLPPEKSVPILVKRGNRSTFLALRTPPNE